MAAIGSIQPEFALDRGKEAGSDNSRIVCDHRARLVFGRFPGDDDLQGSPAIGDKVPDEPDGRGATKVQLVDNPVAAIVLIAKVDWVEASWLVLLEIFTFAVKLARLIPPLVRLGIVVYIMWRWRSHAMELRGRKTVDSGVYVW